MHHVGRNWSLMTADCKHYYNNKGWYEFGKARWKHGVRVISDITTGLISWEMEDMSRNDKVAVKIIIRKSNIVDLCFLNAAWLLSWFNWVWALSLPSSSHRRSHQCLIIVTAIMFFCCLIVTIVAVAILLPQLLYHCIIATLLLSPSSLPQSYHAIVVAVTLPHLPFHRCCHCCSRHTIIVTIASSSPQLPCHHCTVMSPQLP